MNHWFEPFFIAPVSEAQYTDCRWLVSVGPSHWMILQFDGIWYWILCHNITHSDWWSRLTSAHRCWHSCVGPTTSILATLSPSVNSFATFYLQNASTELCGTKLSLSSQLFHHLWFPCQLQKASTTFILATLSRSMFPLSAAKSVSYEKLQLLTAVCGVLKQLEGHFLTQWKT